VLKQDEKASKKEKDKIDRKVSGYEKKLVEKEKEHDDQVCVCMS
jgi:hypothetical protein